MRSIRYQEKDVFAVVSSRSEITFILLPQATSRNLLCNMAAVVKASSAYPEASCAVAPGRPVPFEGRIYYTSEVAVGANFAKYLRLAKPFDTCAENEMDSVRAGLLEFSKRVVSPEYLDSANNAKYMPFTEAGAKAQIRRELEAVAPTVEEERQRLVQKRKAEVFESLRIARAKELARTELGITGFNPYPDQPGGKEFKAAVERFSDASQVIAKATAEAKLEAEAFATREADSPYPAAVVDLKARLLRKFENIQGAVDELFEQSREVTIVILAATKFDGVDVAYAAAGLKNADPELTDRPSLYHESREPALAVAHEMLERGELRDLGVNGPSVGLNMCSMPPFFFGDVTEGHDYARGGNYSQRMLQGNQRNDGGAHVTFWARGDAAGLALSGEEYEVADLETVREWQRCGESRRLYDLKDGGPGVEPIIRFDFDTARCKLVQGQDRNAHLAGGDRYLGLAVPPEVVNLIHRFQRAMMPTGFRVDPSFGPHVSLASLTLHGLPHYKSVRMQKLASALQSSGHDVSLFYDAHIAAHKLYREAWSPKITNWGVYEDAAFKLTQCKYYHRLVDILGYKTAIVSPALSLEDDLPTTTYNGKAATAELRAKGTDTSILRFGAGGIRDFGVSLDGQALHTHITGATYAAHRVSDAAQSDLASSILSTFAGTYGAIDATLLQIGLGLSEKVGVEDEEMQSAAERRGCVVN